VGTGRPQSFQHIAETIAEGMEARIEYVPVPEDIKSQYQKYTCADVTKLRKHYP
jgi:ADP-L-glycero-D-manno-heptose 6-epimerase